MIGNPKNKQRNLGEFEFLILAALVRLGGVADGAAIRVQIEQRAKRDVAVGALYTTLDRMEKKELVRSRLGEATAKRGGRARRQYQIEAKGSHSLRHSLQGIQAMTEGLAIRNAYGICR